MFKFFYYLKYNTYPARVETKCRSLVLIGSKAAFKMFKSEDVRKLLNFNQVDKIEQDRFFNEMTVTNIIMLMLILDKQITEADPGERREYLKAIREEVPKFYLAFLEKIGIPKKYVNIWEKLVDLRYDEYNEDTLEWRQTFMDIDHEVAMNKGVLIFQTLSFGLFNHLRRGKVDPEDELYKYVKASLFPVYRRLIRKIG